MHQRYNSCCGVLDKNKASQNDHEDMEIFTKTLEKYFSGPGIQLKQIVCTEVDYYKETHKNVFLKIYLV